MSQEIVDNKPFDMIIESLNSDYTSLTLSSLPLSNEIINVTLTVKDVKDENYVRKISVLPGTSIRDTLLENGISPYR